MAAAQAWNDDEETRVYNGKTPTVEVAASPGAARPSSVHLSPAADLTKFNDETVILPDKRPAAGGLPPSPPAAAPPPPQSPRPSGPPSEPEDAELWVFDDSPSLGGAPEARPERKRAPDAPRRKRRRKRKSRGISPLVATLLVVVILLLFCAVLLAAAIKFKLVSVGPGEDCGVEQVIALTHGPGAVSWGSEAPSSNLPFPVPGSGADRA